MDEQTANFAGENGGLTLRLRRDWPLLTLLTLAAGFAALAGNDWRWVVPVWLLLSMGVLMRKPAVVALASPPQADSEEAGPDPLVFVSATLAAIDMPVFLIDADLTVLHQNRAAEKAFEALATGAHLSARLRSPGILDMVRETIATGHPNQMEHSERLPSERVFILRVAPVDGVAAAAEEHLDVPPRSLYLLAFREVTELRRIERMRSDFVANASHELRTPLASLRGFIETLQGPAREDPKAQERFLGIMFDQATRMSRLVDDLLSLSRLELKAHIAPDQTVDLKPLIGHVRDTLQPLAGELGVEIRMHMPEGAVEVLGDRDELVQVFENLIENACKYGQEGGVVDVFLRNEPSQPVEVSVVDRGPGIPAEHVPRLTERFYRVSVADSRSKKGTGLGLAIVKHILTRHRARLIVKSEVSKGTTFTVRF